MNRALYKTVYAEAEYEFYEKKSRFIAGIRPVESIEAAKDFISKIKLEHPKATHNVPAFVVGNNMEHTWASDDGEPSSSAGRPMLNLLINEGLTNVVVVATRYFGGIKLGKGGLVRAYTAACKGAVEKACIAAAYSMIKLNVVISHKDYPLIRRNEGRLYSVKDEEFSDMVRCSMAMHVENFERVKINIKDMTSGRCEFGENSSFIERIKLGGDDGTALL